MKPSQSSLRRVVTGAFALLGACTALCAAKADTLGPGGIYTATTGNTTFYGNLPLTYDGTGLIQNLNNYFWSNALTLPKFDSNLGTLTGVSITATWATTDQVVVTNYQGTSETMTVNDTPVIDLGFPGTASSLTTSPFTGHMVAFPIASEIVASTLLNTTTLSGSAVVGTDTTPTATSVEIGAAAVPSSIPNNPNVPASAPHTDSGSQTYTNGTGGLITDLSGYYAAGGGNIVGIAASVDSKSNSTDAGGNIAFNFFNTATVTISITYTYTPSVTKTGCIEGTVWNNKNGKTRCGLPTEVGIGAGVKVNVYDSTGKLVGSAVTLADGTYEVDGLSASTTYTVKIDTTTLPKNYKLVTAACLTVTTLASTATGCSVGNDFGLVLCNIACGHNTFCQEDWNDTSRCSTYRNCLEDNFNEVYPDKCFKIGGTNNYCYFDSGRAVENFLCQGGPDKPLTKGCHKNSTNTNYGTLCGELVACKLNCDFSDAGIFRTGFKEKVCQSGKFKGCTVDQVCKVAHCFLGGEKCPEGTPSCTPKDVEDCLHQVNCDYRGQGGDCGSYHRTGGYCNDGHGVGGDCHNNPGCGDGRDHDNTNSPCNNGGWGGWGGNDGGHFCK